MNTDQIKAIQTKIGTTPDGFWGPKSIARCQAYLRSLMPNPQPWPEQSRVAEFFGKPGDESQHAIVNVEGLGIAYEGVIKKTIRCHKKVQYSLLRVLEEMNRTAEGRAILGRYDGCYNDRAMRGGTAKSMHAWAIAVDFDADHNGNHTHWPTVATMPFSVIEAFSREGWLSAGAFWSRDGMHMQATR